MVIVVGRRTKAGAGDERGEFVQEDDGGNGLREKLALSSCNAERPPGNSQERSYTV